MTQEILAAKLQLHECDIMGVISRAVRSQKSKSVRGIFIRTRSLLCGGILLISYEKIFETSDK